MSESFRAVEWMREARARIEAEDAGLSWEEQQKKTLAILARDPLWAKLKIRVIQSGGPVRVTR
jgi:hypothetical protein